MFDKEFLSFIKREELSEMLQVYYYTNEEKFNELMKCSIVIILVTFASIFLIYVNSNFFYYLLSHYVNLPDVSSFLIFLYGFVFFKLINKIIKKLDDNVYNMCIRQCSFVVSSIIIFISEYYIYMTYIK